MLHLQSLERRRLLSTTFDAADLTLAPRPEIATDLPAEFRLLEDPVEGRLLIFTGTDDGDALSARRFGDELRIVRRFDDGNGVIESRTFQAPIALFDSLEIQGRGGDDSLVSYLRTGDLPGGRVLLRGGEGDDQLTAESDFAELWGDAGDDRLISGGDEARLHGGNGNDDLIGGAGPQALYGGDGDDTLLAAEGNDLLDGGGGSDSLLGGLGQDTLVGSDGNSLSATPAADTLDGGLGTDLLSYQRPAPLVSDLHVGPDESRIVDVDLAAGTALQSNEKPPVIFFDRGVGTSDVFRLELPVEVATPLVETDVAVERVEATDTLVGLENVLGTAGDDLLRGDGGSNLLLGGDGDDLLEGRAGDDTILGNNGADSLLGGDGNDLLIDLRPGIALVFPAEPGLLTGPSNVFDGGLGTDLALGRDADSRENIEAYFLTVDEVLRVLA
jgi:Ca2+-binding RTX toxin-like protein